MPHERAVLQSSSRLFQLTFLTECIECFHSRGQRLCKFIGTKESVCIRKEFNSHRTGLGHQHGLRFIVLGHQYGRRDVMWKHSIGELERKNFSRCFFTPSTKCSGAVTAKKVQILRCKCKVLLIRPTRLCPHYASRIRRKSWWTVLWRTGSSISWNLKTRALRDLQLLI